MLDQPMGRRLTSADSDKKRKQPKYRPPREVRVAYLAELLESTGRQALHPKQYDLLRGDEAPLYFSGDLSLLDRPGVAVVGSRDVSDEGKARAERLARELVAAGITVVSGLAVGIDTAAHRAAMEAHGSTIAVIGTPLDKAYPAENARLQEEIYSDHLLISPFEAGERTFRSSFPHRNRVMAALSDATAIIEASDTSGSLHQAAECTRLGRWLFIAKSLAENPQLSWPSKFLKSPKTAVLTSTDDLVRIILNERP